MPATKTRAIKQTFFWLDWIRFLAALCVVLGHIRGQVFVDYGSLDSTSQSFLVAAFFAVTRLGHEAVVVFFVLSGYLVGGRAIERARCGSFYLIDYAIDRATRIFLPLVPAVALTYLVQLLTSSTDPAQVVLGNVLGVQGIATPVMHLNGPLWSLAYEIWFYILCGSCVALFTMRPNVGLILISFVALVVFTVLKPYLLFCWLLGAIAYNWRFERPSNVSLAIGLSFAVLGVLLRQFGSEGFLNKEWQLQPSIEMATLTFALGVSLVLPQVALLSRTGLSGEPSNAQKVGGWLAAFSYTLYLTHYPVYGLLANFAERRTVIDWLGISMFLGGVAACILVAFLLYLLFERRTDDLRKAWKSTFGDQSLER